MCFAWKSQPSFKVGSVSSSYLTQYPSDMYMQKLPEIDLEQTSTYRSFCSLRAERWGWTKLVYTRSYWSCRKINMLLQFLFSQNLLCSYVLNDNIWMLSLSIVGIWLAKWHPTSPWLAMMPRLAIFFTCSLEWLEKYAVAAWSVDRFVYHEVLSMHTVLLRGWIRPSWCSWTGIYCKWQMKLVVLLNYRSRIS